MLNPYLQTKLVEKVMTDRFGRQFRCLFLVTLVDGEIKAKLVSAELLKPTNYLPACLTASSAQAGQLQTTNSKLYLPILKKKPVISQFDFLRPIASSFIPKDFSFVTSQPIRAPSQI